MQSFYKSFRANILRENFIEAEDSVLVGVSGGVDSMVLAFLLCALQKDIPFELALAHVNYGLRGKESEAQEQLVRDFAVAKKLACFVSKPVLAFEEKENFQSAARDFRYHYFAEIAHEIGANRVTVAHHKEDQIETIFAHLLRGSSLQGLGGMRPMRNLHGSVQLVRPMLSFSKGEICAYAGQNKIAYIDDSSNTSKDYWRNQLRLELLPLVEKLRPKAFDKIVQVGDEMRELSGFIVAMAVDWLDHFSKKEEESFWLPRPRWATLPKTLRLEVLHQAVRRFEEGLKNLKRDHLVRCEQLALGPKTEGYYYLPADLKFIRSGDSLILSRGCVSLKL